MPSRVSDGDMQMPLRIVVLGYLVRCPLGGMAWHHLQYVSGLVSMGHDVRFFEDSGEEPWACYDPTKDVCTTDCTCGLAFASAAFDALGLGNCWAYYDAFRNTFHGPQRNIIREFCQQADVLFNLSGSNILRSWTADIPARIYIDTDPVFTQVRNLSDKNRKKRVASHTSFFTFAENIGSPTTNIPADGFPWQPTRQPIVLDAWPLVRGNHRGPLSTVMQWDNAIQDAPRNYHGQSLGRKAESFQMVQDIPQRSHLRFELAAGGGKLPTDALLVPFAVQDFRAQRHKCKHC